MNCSINCKELKNGVCPPMICLCPKKLKEHDAKVKQDAIDEFVKECEKMKGWINTASSPMSFIYEIAEQLKE